MYFSRVKRDTLLSQKECVSFLRNAKILVEVINRWQVQRTSTSEGTTLLEVVISYQYFAQQVLSSRFTCAEQTHFKKGQPHPHYPTIESW